jgi:hypothetical protein
MPNGRCEGSTSRFEPGTVQSMPRTGHKRTAQCNGVSPRADLVNAGEGGEGALVYQSVPEVRQTECLAHPAPQLVE